MFGEPARSPLEELRGGLVLGSEALWRKARRLGNKRGNKRGTFYFFIGHRVDFEKSRMSPFFPCPPFSLRGHFKTVILSEAKDLPPAKAEILRCAQNDNNQSTGFEMSSSCVPVSSRGAA